MKTKKMYLLIFLICLISFIVIPDIRFDLGIIVSHTLTQILFYINVFFLSSLIISTVLLKFKYNIYIAFLSSTFTLIYVKYLMNLPKNYIIVLVPILLFLNPVFLTASLIIIFRLKVYKNP